MIQREVRRTEYEVRREGIAGENRSGLALPACANLRRPATASAADTWRGRETGHRDARYVARSGDRPQCWQSRGLNGKAEPAEVSRRPTPLLRG